jgi:hypothetical protein
MTIGFMLTIDFVVIFRIRQLLAGDESQRVGQSVETVVQRERSVEKSEKMPCFCFAKREK